MIVLIMISTVKANETHTYLKKKKKKNWNRIYQMSIMITPRLRFMSNFKLFSSLYFFYLPLYIVWSNIKMAV